jgi:small subunit ribosomal protein S4
VIALDTKALGNPVIKARLENSELSLPAWLKRLGPEGQVLHLPNRDDIDSPVNDQLIVEFYSR